MTRFPVFAGRFYEGTEEKLRKRIDDCFLSEIGPGRLPEGSPGSDRRIKALITPHAGYMYSGMTAAHSYLNLYEDGKPDHIVIIGPNHTGNGAPVAVCNDNWETPLGTVKYDTELGPVLVEDNKYINNDCLAHNSEHSIEVQLPFLQHIFGENLSFVPICVRTHDFTVLESIGQTIASFSKEHDILVIASSDFTHFETARSAKLKDNQAMEFLEFLDSKGFVDFVVGHKLSICGVAPIASSVVFSKKTGATNFRLLKYTTSGDVTGDQNNVVAYVSGMFT